MNGADARRTEALGAVGIFEKTLGMAAGGHLLVAAAFARVAAPTMVTVGPEREVAVGTEREVALEDERPVSVTPEVRRPVPAHRPGAARARASSVVTASHDVDVPVAEVAGHAEPPLGAAVPGRTFDIIGSGHAFPRFIGPEPPPRARAVEASIRDALSARDRDLGMSRSGPLVTAAHAAASEQDAPALGSTTIEVDCDASGLVTAARADNAAWDGVAIRVVVEMRGKTVGVPPGAGLRARLRVVAELARASGERGTMSFGAVADDAPGGGKACVGEGIHRECVAGMPVGFTYAKKDLSNVGDAPKRVVHVRILDEAELR